MADHVNFSVLICTYNRHELLAPALRALLDETIEKPDQIVIVNGGDEQADGVIESFQNRIGVEVKLIKTKNVNLATSRNIGLPHCRGDIVAITDDDAKVSPDWVTKMKRFHKEHPEAAAVGGKVFGLDSQKMVNFLADQTVFPLGDTPRYMNTLPGVNCSYKRDAILKNGFYDEVLFRGEDVDYNWRLIRAGYKIYYEPSIVVYHSHRSIITKFVNQVYMYGRAYYVVRSKWEDMYCVYPHQLKTPHDFIKLGYFFVGAFWEPFLQVKKIPKMGKKITTYPMLVIIHFIWKFGMGRQWMAILFEKFKWRLKKYVSDLHGGQLLRNLYMNISFGRYVKKTGEGNALDAGCGIGSYTILFAMHYKGIRFLGIDKDPAHIEIAKQRLLRIGGLHNIDFKSGDLLDLKMRDTFDIIYSADVLEHIEDYQAVLDNFKAGLNTNGLLMIHVPNELQKRHLKRFESIKQADHVRIGFNQTQLKGEIEARGFQILESRYTFGYWGAWAWEISLMAIKNRILAILALPVVFILGLLDILQISESGNGILLVAKKVK